MQLLLDRAMRRLGDSSSAAGMGLQQLINNHMADAPQGDGAAAAAHAMLGRVEELQLADEAGNLQENPEQQGFHGVQQPFDPAAAAGEYAHRLGLLTPYLMCMPACRVAHEEVMEM